MRIDSNKVTRSLEYITSRLACTRNQHATLLQKYYKKYAFTQFFVKNVPIF